MHIGFFDSGIGGVSVAKSVTRDLPQYNYIYYADDTHMPYGDKNQDTLYTLTTTALVQLFERNCKLVILACNSASTVLPRIQQEWIPKSYPDRKVLGVIRPTTEHIDEISQKSKVYVLATPITVKSQSFEHELNKIHAFCDFHAIPCPELAEAIERSVNIRDDQKIHQLCNTYLSSIPANTVIDMYTGCTHYAFVSSLLKELRPLARIHNQGNIVSIKLQDYLLRHPEIESFLSQTKSLSLDTLCHSDSSEYAEKLRRSYHFNLDHT